MSKVFPVMGKTHKYPAKTAILEAVARGETVPLIFACGDNKLIVMTQQGKQAGCLPPNPAVIHDYNILCRMVTQDVSVNATAVYHTGLKFAVEVSI